MVQASGFDTKNAQLLDYFGLAANTPFVYFPLRRHFEQNLHVRHRLERYGAGHPMELSTATPETIAAAIAAALAGRTTPAEVERDGAARAARLIASLL